MRSAQWRTWLARASISVALLAGVVWGSLTEPAALKWMFPGTDKLQHFFAYLVLSAWFAGITRGPKRVVIIFTLIGLGGALELLQHFMGLGRMADYKDFLANSAGVFIGAWLGTYAFRPLSKPSSSRKD